MREGPDIARIAALVADPARSSMLLALMDGRALTATELSSLAGEDERWIGRQRLECRVERRNIGPVRLLFSVAVMPRPRGPRGAIGSGRGRLGHEATG